MAAKPVVNDFNFDAILDGVSSDHNLPKFARPSFDQKPDAVDLFDLTKKSKKPHKSRPAAKVAAISEEVNKPSHTSGRTSVVDVMDLEAPKKAKVPATLAAPKKQKKSVKTNVEEKKSDVVDMSHFNIPAAGRSRGITKALVELTQKTTIVEDLHITDAWGTVTPKARKISASAEDEAAMQARASMAAIHAPRLTTYLEQEDIGGLASAEIDKDPKSGWKGLLAHDDVEERIERIQLKGRRSSAPSVPKFLEKRGAKDEFEEVLENVDRVDKHGRTLPENIRRLLIEANMGWTESQFTLGYCYDTGSGGVEINSQEAIHWYQESAQAGHVTAQNNLGVLLATGHRNRIKPNHAEAFKWYERAAHNGHPNAEFHLGLAHLKGDGVDKKSESEAFRWFRNAAKQGHVLAQANVGAMYMSGQGIEQDFEKARKWCKKAAAQGSAIAHHNLAVIYQRGYGVRPDDQMSRQHLQEALYGANAGIIGKKLSEDTLKAGNTLMNM